LPGGWTYQSPDLYSFAVGWVAADANEAVAAMAKIMLEKCMMGIGRR
jgi:hypothetical protein